MDSFHKYYVCLLCARHRAKLWGCNDKQDHWFLIAWSICMTGVRINDQSELQIEKSILKGRDAVL